VVRLHVNCDVGEEDVSGNSKSLELLSPYITSANIACGFHAGNPALISESIDICLSQGIEIGAHPSFNDRINFGRKSLKKKEGELYYEMLYQLGAINQIIRKKGAQLHHIKPHGALYNITAHDSRICEEMMSAFYEFEGTISVYGLPESIHEETAKKIGLKFVAEGFADRRYQTVNNLMRRELKGSVYYDPNEVVDQVGYLMNEKINTFSEGIQTLRVQTVCVHGDNPNVVEILKTLNEKFDVIKIKDA
jgi:UPF0271 protein